METKRSWVVVMVASLFFFFEFINMNSFDSLNAYLRRDFHIDSLEISHLSAMYFYANVLFLIPAGIILDRFSTKICLLIAVFICTLSDLAFAWTTSLEVAKICRFITGMGSTFCLLSCAKLTSQWFPNRLSGVVMGFVVTNAMIGGMVAQYAGTLAYYLNDDWRITMQIIGAFGVLIFILIAWLVQDAPHSKAQDLDHETLHRIGFLKSLHLAVCNRNTWLAGVYTNLMSTPIVLLGALWGLEYIQTSFGFSHSESAHAIFMIFLGVMIGSPLSGMLSDRMNRRKMPMVIGAVLTLAVTLMLMQLESPSLSCVLILFFLMGLFCSTQVITYALVIETNPKYLTASSEALSASIIMAAGAIFQPLLGWLLEQGFDGTFIQGEKIYSKAAFDQAIWLLPIIFVIACLVALLIRETYCQSTEESLLTSSVVLKDEDS